MKLGVSTMATFIELTQRLPADGGWITRPVQLNLRFVKDYLPIKDDPNKGSVVIYVGPARSVKSALSRAVGTRSGTPAMLVSESVAEIDQRIRAAFD